MSQMERIYFFHNAIIDKEYPNTKTIMKKFGVSESSARRDIDYLGEFLGAPLQFDRTRNGYFYTSSGFRLPFEESPNIVAFLGLLYKMAEEAGLSALPEVTALKEKLSAMLSPGSNIVDAIRFEKIEAEPVNGEKLKAIFDAIQKGVRLRFQYRRPNGEESEREVDPLKLINYQWRWYLAAFCHKRKAFRVFHLPRMSVIKLTEKSCHVCEIRNEELDGLLNRSFGIFKGTDIKNVRIRFIKDAAAVVREQVWHPNQTIEGVQDGIVLGLPVTDFTEIMMKILQFGSRAQVLEPAELKSAMADEIKKMYAGIQPAIRP